MKIAVSGGSAFFIRTEYLNIVKGEDVFAGAELAEDAESDLLNAGLVFAAESKACDYLARAEQSRAGLRRKLLAKGFGKDAVERALNFLEREQLLSDERFARAWLNNRNIGHAEGRPKLLAGLLRRGVGREVAENALEEFCGQSTEGARLSRALRKILRSSGASKLPQEKIIARLSKQGFAYKNIKSALLSAGLHQSPR